MKPRSLAAVALLSALPLALAGAASCGGQTSAPADAAVPPADGGAEGAADAADAMDGASPADADADATDAAALAVVDAGPPLPSWSAEPLPDTRSPMPKPAEWASAPAVALDRESPDSPIRHVLGGCTTHRLREWVRIRCVRSAGMLLLGGNADGIALQRDHAAIFPVRRGDRRVIEISTADTSFIQVGMVNRLNLSFDPGFVISEEWLAAEEKPTIVVSGRIGRHH